MSTPNAIEEAMKAVRLANERLWLEAAEHFVALKRRALDTGGKAFISRELYDALSEHSISDTDDLVSALGLEVEERHRSIAADFGVTSAAAPEAA